MATNETSAQIRERRQATTAALNRIHETFEEQELLTQQYHETIRKKANMVSDKFMISK